MFAELSKILNPTSLIPEESLIILLSIPVMATLVTVSRHIFGWKGLGVLLPLIMTFSLVSLGIIYGVLISVIASLIAILVRAIIKKVRVHYFSRISIILASICLFLIIIFAIVEAFGLGQVFNLPVLPIVLIIVAEEEFIGEFLKHGSKNAFMLYVETLCISTIGYFLIKWSFYRLFLLNWPFALIFLVIVLNIFVGRWKGLRFIEFYRFRKVIKAEKDKISTESK